MIPLFIRLQVLILGAFCDDWTRYQTIFRMCKTLVVTLCPFCFRWDELVEGTSRPGTLGLVCERQQWLWQLASYREGVPDPKDVTAVTSGWPEGPHPLLRGAAFPAGPLSAGNHLRTLEGRADLSNGRQGGKSAETYQSAQLQFRYPAAPTRIVSSFPVTQFLGFV